MSEILGLSRLFSDEIITKCTQNMVTYNYYYWL